MLTLKNWEKYSIYDGYFFNGTKFYWASLGENLWLSLVVVPWPFGNISMTFLKMFSRSCPTPFRIFSVHETKT